MASQQQQVNGLLSPGDGEIQQQVDSSDEVPGNVTIGEDFLLSEMGRSRDMDGDLRKNQKTTTPFIRDEFPESSLEMSIRQAEEDERKADLRRSQEINGLFPPGKIEQQVDWAGNIVEKSLDKLAPEPSEHLSSVTSIYRVPQKLRQASEQYYTPRVVSIGPFHYGNKKYAAMETIKLKSLRLLLEESWQPLKFYVDEFKDCADTARCCYSEKAVGKLESNDDFVQMMLADGAFIIKFMITFGVSNNDVSYDDADPEARILPNLSAQLVSDIKHDLCLLENQLPFSFLKRLNRMFFDNRKSQSRKTIWRKDLISLAAEIWPQLLPRTERMGQRYPNHFLDLLRDSKLPARKQVNEKEPKQLKYRPIKSAKKLHEAGVKVKGATSWFSAEYASFEGDGKLRILPLEIDDTNLWLYKNIMALEQCHYPKQQEVTDYLILMEMLSRDDSDDLLVKKGVLVNKLTTDSTTATSVLRELCKNITYSSRPFGMGTLCKAVNDYCKFRNRIFRAFLYAKTWQIGGAIILLLTLVQTVCSVLALIGTTHGRSTYL